MKKATRHVDAKDAKGEKTQRTQNMKDMKYVSTRGHKGAIASAAAIIAGLTPDRGLYAPETIPALPCQSKDLTRPPAKEDAEARKAPAPPCQAKDLTCPYQEAAKKILGVFLTDFTEEELRVCAERAYDEKFDTREIAPVVKTENAYFLELWHGSTAAFKDMALSALPWLLKTAVKKEGEEKKIAILTATSGDTGKAALAGFADVPGTEIFAFYPKDGVSLVQERQMITQAGSNVHVYGIRGNFDEAQTAVKNVFNDARFAEELAANGVRLSSANSINIGRLVPQVVYYVNAYAKLLADGEIADGEKINICVPTGNFGNILSAWYAKQMGLPVARLICASNENNILADFINTGLYDTRREFILTTSPSMDILVSSNLERLLWHLSGCDSERVRSLMAALDRDGFYDAGEAVKKSLECFHGGFAEMPVSHAALAGLWQEEKYLIDTHTAVAYAVYLDYRAKTGDAAKTVIASTASPYKFAGVVANAIGARPGKDEFETMENLEKATALPIPGSLLDVGVKPILHNNIIGKADVMAAVSSALPGVTK